MQSRAQTDSAVATRRIEMSHERLIIPSVNLASAAPMSAPNAGARRLHKAFWVTVAAITAVIGGTAHVQNVESGIGAVCIGATALLPTWLWITGRVKGLPLFPVFSTTYVYAFAFPLLYEQLRTHGNLPSRRKGSASTERIPGETA